MQVESFTLHLRIFAITIVLIFAAAVRKWDKTATEKVVWDSCAAYLKNAPKRAN